MISRDERERIAIAEQASEWFVTNDAESLGKPEAVALIDWFRASPAHVEEFLGVAGLARDLRALAADPEYTPEALLARTRTASEERAESRWPRAFAGSRDRWMPGRRRAAVAMAAAAVAALGTLSWWTLKPALRVPPAVEPATVRFVTGHGQQSTYRLTDGSMLHLNGESAVTVRYGLSQRLIVLTSGEAAFEVAHEPRSFRVLAGPVEVVDLGTRFDVRLGPDSALVTVIAGRVAVTPVAASGKGPGSAQARLPVAVGADQQVLVSEGRWPVSPIAVDAQRATSWLHRQIAFDHEPLSRVAAEFNRYAPKPIEIVTPKLRQLEISGVFSTDDPEELVAFLRSLEGVRVEVTATQIRVSQK